MDVPVPGLGGAIADAFREVALPVRGTLFGSWDDEQRKEFRRHLPDADLLLSEGAPARWDASYFAERTRQGVTTFEIANWSPEFLASAHAHGFPVWVYTVNDETTMRAIIDAGADGIETDDPALALRVARED